MRLSCLCLHVAFESHLSELGLSLLRLLSQLFFPLFGFFGDNLVFLILELSVMTLFFQVQVELLNHLVLLGIL